MDFGIFILAAKDAPPSGDKAEPEGHTGVGDLHEAAKDMPSGHTAEPCSDHPQAIPANLIFRFGHCMGQLGPLRTFLLVSDGTPADCLPDDLRGSKLATYNPCNPNLQAELGPAATWFRNIMKSQGRRILNLPAVTNDEATQQLDLLRIQKDVYTYVFNRLNPYPDLSLTQAFLRTLPANQRFDRIDDVMRPLDSLIHDYVPRFLSPRMRVYFAYKLINPDHVTAHSFPGVSAPMRAYYRVGISFSAVETRWYEGLPIGIPSNTHAVYTRRTVRKVRDAHRAIFSNVEQNQPVDDEGSVIGLPVTYRDGRGNEESIGVIGMSSPERDEVTNTKYESLAHELSILFSALFYAWGHQFEGEKTFGELVAFMRKSIADYFGPDD
jgi:hypothetical protein